jgi:hypothetical protein
MGCQARDEDDQKISPVASPPWPRHTPLLSRPSSPPSSPRLPPTSSPPPFSSPPRIHGSLKRERVEDYEADNQPLYKQQKISQFFAKLTQAEGLEQATRHLVQSADTRDEWVHEQEAKTRAKKATRQASNTHSQRESRARKKEREIQSGARRPDGKVKKVIKSDEYRAIVNCELEMATRKTTAIPFSRSYSTHQILTPKVPDNFQSCCKVKRFYWRKTQVRAAGSEEDRKLVLPVNLGSN